MHSRLDENRSLSDILASMGIHHEAIANGNGYRRLILTASGEHLGNYDCIHAIELVRQAETAA